MNNELYELFKRLHGAQVKYLLNRLETGEITHQELETARKILADNGIDDAGKPQSPIHQLGEKLPFPPEDTVDPDGDMANYG